MNISNFNVTDVRLRDVEFKIKDDSFAGNIDIETALETRYSLDEDRNNNAKLQMVIKIFHNTEKAPFSVSLTMEGIFRWEDDIERDELEMFLEVNGSAVLYSYARPVISQLTTFAGFPALVLPLNNFVKMHEEA